MEPVLLFFVIFTMICLRDMGRSVSSWLRIPQRLRPLKSVMHAKFFKQVTSSGQPAAISTFSENENNCIVFGSPHYLWLVKRPDSLGDWKAAASSLPNNDEIPRIAASVKCVELGSPVYRLPVFLRRREMTGNSQTHGGDNKKLETVASALQLRKVLSKSREARVVDFIATQITPTACDVVYPRLNSKMFVTSNGYARVESTLSDYGVSFRGFPWPLDHNDAENVCESVALAVNLESILLLNTDVHVAVKVVREIADSPDLPTIYGYVSSLYTQKFPSSELVLGMDGDMFGWSFVSLTCDDQVVQLNPKRARSLERMRRGSFSDAAVLFSFVSDGFAPALCAEMELAKGQTLKEIQQRPYSINRVLESLPDLSMAYKKFTVLSAREKVLTALFGGMGFSDSIRHMVRRTTGLTGHDASAFTGMIVS